MTTRTAGARLALTRNEAAAAMGVSLSTIERAIASGRLRAKKTGPTGGRYLIKVSDLEAWFDGLEDA